MVPMHVEHKRAHGVTVSASDLSALTGATMLVHSAPLCTWRQAAQDGVALLAATSGLHSLHADASPQAEQRYADLLQYVSR